MTIRVAVTGISGDAGLGAIRGLRATRAEDEDIWILGLDSGQDCAARHRVDAFGMTPILVDRTRRLPSADCLRVTSLSELGRLLSRADHA